MSKTGLRVSFEGKPFDQRNFQYDSDKGHLQVDLKITPKHADILDTPKITAFANGAVSQYETLLAVKHGLTFIPKCAAWFYVYDAPAAGLLAAGEYIGEVTFLSGGGLYNDTLYYSVDETYFYIKHYFDDSSGWLTSTGRTSLSDQYKLRIKYFIYNNEGRKPRWAWDN